MGYEKVIFLGDDIDDNLKCAICFGVCEEATTACLSGHTFCATCLQLADRGVAVSNGGGGDKCPTCRAYKINAPNRPLRGMIDALRVRCAEGRNEGGEPEKKKKKKSRTDGKSVGDDDNDDDPSGCKWEGKLGDWRDTHRKECPFVIVRCPYECGKQLRRMDMDEHKKECHMRQVECDLCNEMMDYCALVGHKKEYCPKAMAKCDYCEQEMIREELGDREPYYEPREKIEGVERIEKRTEVTGHYAVCPKMVLACEFCKRGCKAQFKREDAAAHHAEKAQFHAALVDETIDRLYNRLNWDFVQINWEIPSNKLIGSQNKVLQSKVVSGVSQYDLYLKLYLRRPGDPIKVAICSNSISCRPVNKFVLLKDVELEVVDHETSFRRFKRVAIMNDEEERKVEFQDGVAGMFEFSSTLKRCFIIYRNEEFTRSDIIGASTNYYDKVVIRAHFFISKESRVLLSCDD